MNKIAKKTRWLTSHGKLVSGILFIAWYFIAVVLGEWNNIIIIGMFVLGIGDIYMYYRNKKRNWDQEYIAWDEEKIVVQQFRQESLIYLWNEVDELKLTEGNLTIKSGAAKGIMFELKDFKAEDVEQLKLLKGFKSVA